jgi:RimJ/RimL family protein N-acetyltransferase
MGYQNDGTDDFDKLVAALGDLSTKFGSIDDILQAFGLADMPLAQRYGILFGFITFFCTVSAVIALLVYGGSFRRMAEQAETGHATFAAPHDARAQRALLFEDLLESRRRMMTQNYESQQLSEQPTKLTHMLLNLKPPKEEDKKDAESYKSNYVIAYRACQDKMGGPALSGRPEARFEAYARAYASCGTHTTTSYRRSYGRLYEAIACANHHNEEKFSKLWDERPQDIVGRYVRLEALEVDRHLNDLYAVTSGQPTLGNSNYDPQEIWSFLEEGPFPSPEALRQARVFQHKPNEAAFGIVHSVTDRLIGAIYLTKDDPEYLSIQLEAPLLQPALEGTPEQLEACFLLLDRLFANGYRRVQMSVDAQDPRRRKLAGRLGCTHEGTLSKHMIVKDSSRDSAIFSLLNSDWKAGARNALFARLYGKAAAAADLRNEQKSAELEEQSRFLEEAKLQDSDKKSK